MANAGAKTVRFTQVVERSGRPHVHTLWLPPDKDPEFKRARDTHRVMTIAQSPGGGKADVGLVGFDEKHDQSGQFLIFPQSLKRFEGARVVGVKFDLVEQPKLAAAKLEPRKAPTRAKSKPSTRFANREPTWPAAAPPRARVRHTEREPEPEPEPPPQPATPAPAPRTQTPEEKRTPAHAALLREVRAALKDIERGKYVAAHQRLTRAIA